MDIFEKIRQTLPLGEDWEEFEKILKLPDDKFNAIYPVYKEKFQKFQKILKKNDMIIF